MYMMYNDNSKSDPSENMFTSTLVRTPGVCNIHIVAFSLKKSCHGSQTQKDSFYANLDRVI